MTQPNQTDATQIAVDNLLDTLKDILKDTQPTGDIGFDNSAYIDEEIEPLTKQLFTKCSEKGIPLYINVARKAVKDDAGNFDVELSTTRVFRGNARSPGNESVLLLSELANSEYHELSTALYNYLFRGGSLVPVILELSKFAE